MSVDTNLDLREWVATMEDLGELQVVSGADRDYEIGAITDLNAKKRGKALLFDDIPGFEGKGRVVSCTMSRAARLAATLGLDPALTDMQLVRALRGKPAQWERDAPRFDPVTVTEGAVTQEVLSRGQFDLTDIPAPLWHEGDGGHYIGTGSLVITKDPDDDVVNVGTYRVMVHGPDRLGVFIEQIHGGSIHIRKFHERGEPCPVVISFGHHPLVFLGSAMPLPYGLNELNYVGAIRGKPVDVIRGEVTGLPIPADAEIVAEGWIYPDDVAAEGPFGEFTGYFAGGRRERPVVQVERLYRRQNPILLGSLPGKPPFDHSYWRSTIESSMLLDRLTSIGLPDITGVWKHEAGCAQFWTVVSLKQRYAGHAEQAGMLAATASEGASMGRYVVVVDDDIDVTNLEDVIWGMSTRSDPVRNIQFLNKTPSNPLDPLVDENDPEMVTSRAIINACRPYGRISSFAEVVEVSEGLAKQVHEKFGSTLGW